MDEATEFTQDGIFSRAITLWQPRKGYRFGVDSVLLGCFAREHAEDAKVLELGAGVGVISLVLAFPVPGRRAPREIVAVELQERLAKLATQNVLENRLKTPIQIIQGDLKKLPNQESGRLFDLVLSNPPYYLINEGQREPDEERAVARREISATISDVLSCAARCLHAKGKLALVYPAAQLPRLFSAVEKSSFQWVAMQPVYSREGREAELVLALFKLPSGKAVPPLSILPPLVLADAQGKQNPEIERLLQRGY